MSNMSYCRFENTYHDLQDCREHINDDLGGDELKFRNWLIEMCQNIVDEAEELEEQDEV